MDVVIICANNLWTSKSRLYIKSGLLFWYMVASALATASAASELADAVATVARRLAAEYARSRRRVKRLAARQSLSNHASEGRCRRTNWRIGNIPSSWAVSRLSYTAAISSTSSGQSPGWHNLDAERTDRNSSKSRWRQAREHTGTKGGVTLTSQHSSWWSEMTTSTTSTRPGQPTSSFVITTSSIPPSRCVAAVWCSISPEQLTSERSWTECRSSTKYDGSSLCRHLYAVIASLYVILWQTESQWNTRSTGVMWLNYPVQDEHQILNGLHLQNSQANRR